MLTNPIFFRPEDWITIPSDWKNSIVQGKSYSLSEPIGREVWQKVVATIYKCNLPQFSETDYDILQHDDPEVSFGLSILRRVRMGQGAFRVLVTDAYSRRCAFSGEKTLPVLEAAHIKPVTQSGPHIVSNSLLLRSDFHTLFDSGYISITAKHEVIISDRIRTEFENGKEYYKLHGKPIINLPLQVSNYPDKRFVEYHNQNIFKG